MLVTIGSYSDFLLCNAQCLRTSDADFTPKNERIATAHGLESETTSAATAPTRSEAGRAACQFLRHGQRGLTLSSLVTPHLLQPRETPLS